jgi:hypothetical protein
MKRINTLAVVLFSLLLAGPALADDAKKEKLARELMALSGAADMGKQVMHGMMEQFRSNPAIPPKFVDKFLELAKPEQLVEMVVPLYVRIYDEETLAAAVAFYKTKSGKALIAGLPQITQESMALGQKWGQELAAKVLSELNAQKP